jgi:hypothetical protein
MKMVYLPKRLCFHSVTEFLLKHCGSGPPDVRLTSETRVGKRTVNELRKLRLCPILRVDLR